MINKLLEKIYYNSNRKLEYRNKKREKRDWYRDLIESNQTKWKQEIQEKNREWFQGNKIKREKYENISTHDLLNLRYLIAKYDIKHKRRLLVPIIISLEDKWLQEKVGSKETLKRVIRKAMELNLIYEVYQGYYNIKKGTGKAREFIWNQDQSERLKQVIKSRGYRMVNGEVKISAELMKKINTLSPAEYSKVDFGTDLRLSTKLDCGIELTDEVIEILLERNNSQYAHYKMIVNEINKMIPEHEGKIRFQAHITRSTPKDSKKGSISPKADAGHKQSVWQGGKTEPMIMKIGIRACSLFSGFKKTQDSTMNRNDNGLVKTLGLPNEQDLTQYIESSNELMMDMTRENYAEYVFGKKPMEYDQSASIYTVTNLVNNGVWGLIPKNSWTKDPYELLFGDSFSSKTDEWQIERKAYKSLAMNLYFTKTNELVYEHLKWRFMPEEELGKPEGMGHVFLDDWDESRIKDELNLRWGNMVRHTGLSLGSKVFLHESCIYLDVTKKLLESGAKVLTCYDEWYWAYPDGVKIVYNESNIAELIKDCAIRYYNLWIIE